MTKLFCQNCIHMRKAEEHEHYEDQIRFARCSKFLVANVYADVSMAFDTKSPMQCWQARADTSRCGPNANGYEEAA